MNSKVFFLTACVFCSGAAFGQDQPKEDSLQTSPVDTVGAQKGKRVVTIETYAKRFNPRKAMMLSAAFPGMGQLYNKKYWKMPLVYGGFVGCFYAIDHYQTLYVTYKDELFALINDPASNISPSGYTEDQLRQIINTSRRQRDLFTILTGIWYMLQLVDAHVDAHLKEFDLNPQLQVKLEPTMENEALTGRTTGLSLKIKF